MELSGFILLYVHGHQYSHELTAKKRIKLNNNVPDVSVQRIIPRFTDVSYHAEEGCRRLREMPALRDASLIPLTSTIFYYSFLFSVLEMKHPKA